MCLINLNLKPHFSRIIKIKGDFIVQKTGVFWDFAIKFDCKTINNVQLKIRMKSDIRRKLSFVTWKNAYFYDETADRSAHSLGYHITQT